MKLAVVIPCYNEKDNIPLIVQRIGKTFKDRKNIDVILVDNGSTDASEEVFLDYIKGQDLIRYIKINKNQGYGHGILYGINAAPNADVYAWTHADMQTDPAHVLKAFDLLRAKGVENKVIKGKRNNRSALDALFTFGMQVFASALLGVKFNDVNAQPKVFSKHFFDNHIRGKAPLDFSLDLFLLYQGSKAGYSTLTIPVDFPQRAHGEAKGGGNWPARIKLIKRTFSYILFLRKSINAVLPE